VVIPSCSSSALLCIHKHRNQWRRLEVIRDRLRAPDLEANEKAAWPKSRHWKSASQISPLAPSGTRSAA
jgi:hypothetical protein